MIEKIEILQHGECRNLGSHPREEAQRLLGIVAYHHEVVIQLRKDGLNSLSETFVGSCGRCPVLLVQACATSWFAPTIPVIRQVSLVPGFGPKERGPEVIEVDGR